MSPLEAIFGWQVNVVIGIGLSMAEIVESPKPFGDIAKVNKGHFRNEGTRLRADDKMVSFSA